MEVFTRDNHAKVRLSDGSSWLIFENPDALMKIKDWGSFLAIELLDQKNFEFLFLNEIELSIPKEKLSFIYLKKESITAIIQSDYERVVLK